jgi:hypothetical protein
VVREIIAVRFLINFCPGLPVQRTLNHPRFQIPTADWVMSGANAHFVEIPANP